MYSGTTFRHHSGNVIGVHQRIDRIAKRHYTHKMGHSHYFPTIRSILHFEGKNGPDGIKSKSPSVDEPWHFINPSATADDPLIRLIEDHIYNLSVAIEKRDEERSAFEASWLAHAIVDGLTPAHHYPLADKIKELWGKPHTERLTRADKIIIKGTGKRDMLAKNWQYWGAKGIFNLHWSFELGVASSITISKFKDIGLTEKDYTTIEKEGFVPTFLASLKAVHELGMYEEFAETGWSVHLGNVSRRKLIPIISKAVCLAWYAAAHKVA